MDMYERILQLARVRAMARSGVAREIRENAKLSLSEVATAVGCSASAVHRWETAGRAPTGDLALAYLEVLDRLSNSEAVRTPRNRK